MNDEVSTPWVVRSGGLWLGIGLAALVLLLPPPDGWSPESWKVLACIALMVCWWISEAIPVYATGLVPLVLFPLLGIATPRDAAEPYADPLIFLFLGGFMIAQAMQAWGLHRRIALRLLALTGTGPRALVGGFMAACAFLSMWISNTATAVMMLPIALSVVALLEESGLPLELEHRFERALLLSIAYACSIGGVATLIGTPPNAILAAYLAREHDIVITFADWMAVGLPLSLLLLALAWLLLTRVVFRLPNQSIDAVSELISRQRSGLGPMGRGEKLALAGFVTAAVLWIGRGPIEKLLPGLGLSDAGIAIAVSLALFAAPVNAERGVQVLNWSDARKLPWGVLLLFGGGLSLARAVDGSGLAAALGDLFGRSSALPWWLIVLVAVTAIVFLTEVMSNTATTAAFLPVAAAVAVSMGAPVTALAIPVALAASCAFMLPAATPPNAVVFGSGRLAIHQMARAGLLFNVVAIAVIAAASTLL